MVRMVHHGTHIEGNKLDIEQAEKVLAGQKVLARERDIQEVINYRKVMEHINKLQIANSKLQIDEKMIKEVHALTVYRILPRGKVGRYRGTQVIVKNSQTGEVTFRPPKAPEVKNEIVEFVHWVNSDQNDVYLVLKAGIVHYELARIHPFVDGNGRVARALSTLVLFQGGYDIRKFFSLEEYFDSDPENYYSALQSVEKREGDLTEWLTYFTHGLAIELGKIKEKIQKLSVDVALKEKLGGQVALTDRQIKIIEYMQKVGFLQNKAFPTLFPMVSEDTILRELKDLIKKRIIKKIGRTKAARYVMR